MGKIGGNIQAGVSIPLGRNNNGWHARFGAGLIGGKPINYGEMGKNTGWNVGAGFTIGSDGYRGVGFKGMDIYAGGANTNVNRTSYGGGQANILFDGRYPSFGVGAYGGYLGPKVGAQFKASADELNGDEPAINAGTNLDFYPNYNCDLKQVNRIPSMINFLNTPY